MGLVDYKVIKCNRYVPFLLVIVTRSLYCLSEFDPDNSPAITAPFYRLKLKSS